MAITSKKPPHQLQKKLVFMKEWIVDPGPELKKVLSAQALRDIDQAKKDFGNRVNEILKKG